MFVVPAHSGKWLTGGCAGQDALELLRYFIDGLHQEMTKRRWAGSEQAQQWWASTLQEVAPLDPQDAPGDSTADNKQEQSAGGGDMMSEPPTSLASAVFGGMAAAVRALGAVCSMCWWLGQLASVVRCLRCYSKSVTMDGFTEVALPIPKYALSKTDNRRMKQPKCVCVCVSALSLVHILCSAPYFLTAP